jgi:hypothetical protein
VFLSRVYPDYSIHPEPFYYNQGVVVAAPHEDISFIHHPNDLAVAPAIQVDG